MVSLSLIGVANIACPELRLLIYSYILPSTFKVPNKTQNSFVWIPGETAILRASRQVHDECAEVLYGRNTFVFDVAYDDRIDFHKRRLIPKNGLMVKRLYHFPLPFLERPEYVFRIRNVVININHVDSYLGMINYNCQNTEALTAGVRTQVHLLVEKLRRADQLNRVAVHFTVGSSMMDEIRQVRGNSRIPHRVQAGRNVPETQTALEPLKELDSVKEPTVEGAVTPEYASMLENCMQGNILPKDRFDPSFVGWF